eukprot:GHVU01097321.1.p1 GENE.GHVU01097321.1~~GHVU01097321.1.p1  ORF type:complete len:545 (+),score=107.13 GHVU01097321.1:166-1800(+)
MTTTYRVAAAVVAGWRPWCGAAPGATMCEVSESAQRLLLLKDAALNKRLREADDSGNPVKAARRRESTHARAEREFEGAGFLSSLGSDDDDDEEEGEGGSKGGGSKSVSGDSNRAAVGRRINAARGNACLRKLMPGKFEAELRWATVVVKSKKEEQRERRAENARRRQRQQQYYQTHPAEAEAARERWRNMSEADKDKLQMNHDRTLYYKERNKQQTRRIVQLTKKRDRGEMTDRMFGNAKNRMLREMIRVPRDYRLPELPLPRRSLMYADYGRPKPGAVSKGQQQLPVSQQPYHQYMQQQLLQPHWRASVSYSKCLAGVAAERAAYAAASSSGGAALAGSALRANQSQRAGRRSGSGPGSVCEPPTSVDADVDLDGDVCLRIPCAAEAAATGGPEGEAAHGGLGNKAGRGETERRNHPDAPPWRLDGLRGAIGTCDVNSPGEIYGRQVANIVNSNGGLGIPEPRQLTPQQSARRNRCRQVQQALMRALDQRAPVRDRLIPRDTTDWNNTKRDEEIERRWKFPVERRYTMPGNEQLEHYHKLNV